MKNSKKIERLKTWSSGISYVHPNYVTFEKRKSGYFIHLGLGGSEYVDVRFNTQKEAVYALAILIPRLKPL